jgi:hypothetical protein
VNAGDSAQSLAHARDCLATGLHFQHRRRRAQAQATLPHPRYPTARVRCDGADPCSGDPVWQQSCQLTKAIDSLPLYSGRHEWSSLAWQAQDQTRPAVSAQTMLVPGICCPQQCARAPHSGWILKNLNTGLSCRMACGILCGAMANCALPVSRADDARAPNPRACLTA